MLFGKDHDSQLVEHEFPRSRWKEMYTLNVCKSEEELVPALACVLNGAAIDELVPARQLRVQLSAEINLRPKTSKLPVLRASLQKKVKKFKGLWVLGLAHLNVEQDSNCQSPSRLQSIP